jgi:signal transduction histidine kinase
MIASPVYNRNNNIIGVLAVNVNLKNFMLQTIESARLGSRGYLMLFDSRGRLVAQGNYPGADQHQSGTSFVNVDRVRQVLTGAVFDGKGSGDRYNSLFNRKPVVGAGSLIENLGWGLIVEWPLDDADIVIAAIRSQLLGVMFGSIIIVLVLAPFLASRIVQPIKELKKSAAAIEKGDFTQHVSIATRDELEDLGRAFNKMTDGLKRLEELRKEFVFIAAHELRTPVTATKWSLSLVLDGTLGAVPDAFRDTLEKIKTANDRLVQLVNDILEIARNDAGRLKIQVASHDIAEAIRAIIAEAEPLAKEKNIALTYSELPDMPRVLMDPDRVKEIVMNFISNAIKYNRQGGFVKIYHERAGDKFATHVEDNGFGIAEEDQKHMFEKFFRSESREIKEIIGTGLGLFITRELVEKMNGTVWFRSVAGQGSRFSFSLPVSSSRG